MTASTIKALAFDVFGTVVDYRGTMIREGEGLNRAKGLSVDWGQFADAWRARYRPVLATSNIRSCISGGQEENRDR